MLTTRSTGPDYLRAAIQIQRVTRDRLGLLIGGKTATRARMVGYRRASNELEHVDQWYLASQLWADAELIRAWDSTPPTRRAVDWDRDEAQAHLAGTARFLEALWEPSRGGYAPRCDTRGEAISRPDQYTDDNALAGLALLAAAEAVDEPRARADLVDQARRVGGFLTRSGLWSGTFGGGFWWNNRLGDSAEGKPAQSNALAGWLFARLATITGEPAHRRWALAVSSWLDATLFDDDRCLYRWAVSHADLETRSDDPVVHQRYFNYDQAIAIDMHLELARLTGDGRHVDRALAIGAAIEDAFANRARGGWNLESGVEQVFASYAAWTCLGHLALFHHTADPAWHARAISGAIALVAALAQPNGSIACRHAGAASACTVDPAIDGAAHAWTQHLLAANAAEGRASSVTRSSTIALPTPRDA